MIEQNKRTAWLFYYLLFAFLGGLVSFYFLISIKSEAENAFFLGFSKPRLVLILTFGLLLSVLGLLAGKMRLNERFIRNANRFYHEFVGKGRFYQWIVSLCLFVIILFLILYWDISASDHEVYLAYFERIEPIFWWFFSLSIGTLLFVRVYRFGTASNAFEKFDLVHLLLPLLLCVLIFLVFHLTQIGLIEDKFQWRGPGTPILTWQVFLSALISLGVVKGSAFVGRKLNAVQWLGTIKSSKLDIALSIILWMIAFTLWRAEPLNPTWFNPSPAPPNFEFYPSSDAAVHDISAYHLLIGNGFEGYVRRPLLSAFLALGHWLLGSGYDSIVDFQLLFYSIFPVCLYLLGRGLHNRASGLTIAGMAIFREVTALKLSGIINVSNSKMIMSDFPTMVGILIVVYLVSYWLASRERPDGWLFAAGGLIGLLMLIRLQVVVLSLVILVFILLKHGFQRRFVFRSSSLFIFGLVVVVLPWLTRNFFVNGSFNFTDFSNPTQGGLIQQRYQGSAEDAPQAYGSTLDFIREKPKEVLGFISAHFFHNQINTLLVLPSAGNFSAMGYITSLPYWPKWFGGVSRSSILPMGINLFLIILGIAAAWRRHRLAGVFPLGAFFGYVFVISVFRISGWRFLMPVDWVGYLYFGIGLVQGIAWIKAYFMNETSKGGLWEFGDFSREEEWLTGNRWISIGVVFFLISASIPIFEGIIPQKYTSESLQIVLDETEGQLPVNADAANLNRFLAQENSIAVHGIALYPSFFEAGEGHVDSKWEHHLRRDYSRFGFLILNGDHDVTKVVLPVESSPSSFPNGSEVLVLACQGENYVRANLVHLLDRPDPGFMYSTDPDWDCRDP